MNHCLLFLALNVAISESTESAPAWTDEPAAMVEQIVDGPDGLSNFDYVYPGRVVDLGKDGSLTLIYFENCLREKIRGGEVTVRELQSEVREPAQLTRTAADCGSMHILDTPTDLRTSAAMVFRGQDKITVVESSAPCLVTSGQSNWLSIIEMRSGHEIFRLRQPGRKVDLAAYGLILKPGLTYQVRTDENSIIVRVSVIAKPDRVSEPVTVGEELTEKTPCGYP